MNKITTEKALESSIIEILDILQTHQDVCQMKPN